MSCQAIAVQIHQRDKPSAMSSRAMTASERGNGRSSVAARWFRDVSLVDILDNVLKSQALARARMGPRITLASIPVKPKPQIAHVFRAWYFFSNVPTGPPRRLLIAALQRSTRMDVSPDRCRPLLGATVGTRRPSDPVPKKPKYALPKGACDAYYRVFEPRLIASICRRSHLRVVRLAGRTRATMLRSSTHYVPHEPPRRE